MNNLKLTPGKIYDDFEQLVKSVEKWMEKENPQITGCDSSQVNTRIVQQIVQIIYVDYSEQVLANERQSLKSGTQLSRVFSSNGLKICTETGKVSITFKQALGQTIYFTAKWSYYFLMISLGLFMKPGKYSTAATVLMEAGGNIKENDSLFVQFCQSGPIRSLRLAKSIIVCTKSPPNKSTSDKFSYSSTPFLYIVNNFLQRSSRFFLLFAHTTAPYYFLKALINNPVSILIAQDISMLPFIKWLDKNEHIDAIVITTSSFTSQPIWMKGLVNTRFKLHMLWYSQNFIPKMYLGDEKRPNLPPARHMRVDVHWVWTEGFKSYLRELGQSSEIQVVGPILWYLPEKISCPGNAAIKIAVFDITPLPDGQSGFGATKNYYSVSTIKKFISDILRVCNEITEVTGNEIVVLLKHKRAPISGFHDFGYLEYLEKLAKEQTNFILISNETNLFGLLEELKTRN